MNENKASLVFTLEEPRKFKKTHWASFKIRVRKSSNLNRSRLCQPFNRIYTENKSLSPKAMMKIQDRNFFSGGLGKPKHLLDKGMRKAVKAHQHAVRLKETYLNRSSLGIKSYVN